METKEVTTILNNLTIDEKLDIRERAAINEALMIISNLEYKKEKQYDFQGWPIDKLTMKELRKFVKDNCALDDDVALRIFQDDGMGYGARNGYCFDIYLDENNEGEKEVRFWF